MFKSPPPYRPTTHHGSEIGHLFPVHGECITPGHGVPIMLRLHVFLSTGIDKRLRVKFTCLCFVFCFLVVCSRTLHGSSAWPFSRRCPLGKKKMLPSAQHGVGSVVEKWNVTHEAMWLDKQGEVVEEISNSREHPCKHVSIAVSVG